MTEAIFGLVGVIVGAVAQGGWAWTMERRREEWAARKAGRLLARGLARARWGLRAASRGSGSWRILAMEIEDALRDWPEHAKALAGTLEDSDQWHEIVQGVEALERVHHRAKYGSEGTFDAEDRDGFRTIANLTWDAAFQCSLIGVGGIRRHRVRDLMRRVVRRVRRFDADAEARRVIEYAYTVEGETPPDWEEDEG